MNNVYINIKDFGELYIGKYLYEKLNKDIISIEELISILEDEIAEKENWKEEYENLVVRNNETYEEHLANEFDDRWHSGEFE